MSNALKIALNQTNPQKSLLVLAPMEGVTDAPMRHFLTRITAPDFCVTEFVRVSQNILPPKAFYHSAPELKTGAKTQYGTPLVVQILGGDPTRVAESAAAAVQAGAPSIDLNFGCPAPIVNRNDGGAALLQDPPRLEAIVAAVRARLPEAVTVSAKLRLGWDKPEAILENARRAEAGGADWITIHARTRMQAYQPPAFWEWIGEVRKILKVPVIANGDIWTIDDFRKCKAITGCHAFMLGRTALANPLIFEEIRAWESGAEIALETPWSEWFQDFYTSFVEFGVPSHAIVKKFKQWLRWVEQRGGPDYFSRIKRSEKIDDVLEILQLSSGAEEVGRRYSFVSGTPDTQQVLI